MGKPTPEEKQKAMCEATRLREQREDDFYLGKTLLNMNYCMGFLLDVLNKADLYLHSGEGAVEHSELVRTIEQARAALQDPDASGDEIHPW